MYKLYPGIKTTLLLLFSLLTVNNMASAQKVVVNKIYNHSSTTDGLSDAIELLVVGSVVNMQNLVFKDFESNITLDNGGKYRFKPVPLWASLKAGTTIVIRRKAGLVANYIEDVDGSDLTIDLLMDNTDYFENLTTGNGGFNITQVDMVMIKSGSGDGVDGAIHTFATGNGGASGIPSALFNSVPGKKLVSSDNTTNPRFQYPLIPTGTLADYDGKKAAIAASGVDRAWGVGYSIANKEYITALRTTSTSSSLNADAVELLVIKDNMDMRALLIKDFSAYITEDKGGKYRFNTIAFWSSLRSGTTIVLRANKPDAGYTEDTDGADFTIDLLLQNTTYFTNESEDPANEVFDITGTDMVMLKAGDANGTDGAIHTFASNNGGGETPSPLYTSISSGKVLTSTETNLEQHFQYPTSPTLTLADYTGTETGIADLGSNPDWGMGYLTNNKQFIQNLRGMVLPIKLISFAGKQQTDGIKLNWSSATENNNSHFEILKYGKNNFQPIGIVAGHGTTNETINYTFLDKLPQTGLNYYQLKQVDFDGKSITVAPIQVRFDALTTKKFTVYYNKESKELHLSYDAANKTTGVLSIIDLNGHILRKYNLLLEEGNNQLNLGQVSFEQGVFVGTLTTSIDQRSVKFIL